MLTTPSGLSPDQLAAVAALERRVVDHDGGRLKLEPAELARRSGARAEDVLWTVDGELVGFLGLYGFGQPTVELAGMVDPVHRRRGIGSALVREGLRLAREHGCTGALLVTSGGPGAAAFAAGLGGVAHHSEHALLLRGEPVPGPTDPALTIRDAGPADTPVVLPLLLAAFGAGHGPDRVAEPTPQERTLLVERDGTPVATLRRDLHGTRGAVYGFAVDPALQGRGIGRDVLRRVCADLRTDGATEVALEVEVANTRALGLYTSLGFTRVATEEYVTLPL